MGIVTVPCCMGLGGEAAKLPALGTVVGFAWAQALWLLKTQTEIPTDTASPRDTEARTPSCCPQLPQEPRQTGLT